MTIDVREAVIAAQKSLQSMADLMGGYVLDIRLEEVELSEDKSLWLITLSFIIPISKDSISNLGILAGESLKPERQYTAYPRFVRYTKISFRNSLNEILLN